MQLKLDYDDARRTTTIERAVVNQSRYRAGDKVAISLTLRPYGKSPITLPVEFALPADLPKGTVRVVITGGKEANAGRAGLGAPIPDPTNVDQMLEQYTRKNSALRVGDASGADSGAGRPCWDRSCPTCHGRPTMCCNLRGRRTCGWNRRC